MPPCNFRSLGRVTFAALSAVLLVLATNANAAPGEYLSDRTLLVRIDGNLASAALVSANVWDEPYTQQRNPREQDDSVFEVYDAGGALIVEVPAVPIELTAVPFRRGSYAVESSFAATFTIPDLPEIAGARIRYLEVNPETGTSTPRFLDVEGFEDLAERIESAIPEELLVGDQLVRWPAAETFDVVLLAEGYTEAERAQFESVAAAYVNDLLSTEPWNEYADRLNFRTVFRASAESGASTIEDPKDTAYDLQYGGTIRKCPINISSQLPLLMQDARWGAADFVAVLINEGPGTAAGVMPACTDMHRWIAVTGANAGYASWFRHEMNHWGMIGEEDEGYEGDSSDYEECQWEPLSLFMNLTGDSSCSKWEEWFGEEGVGCYPGGLDCYDNSWHPGPACGMSINLFNPICPVCREAVLYRILAFSDAVKAATATRFSVRPGASVWMGIDSKVSNGTIVWYKKVNYAWQPVQYGGESYRFLGALTGTHEFKATVTDPTAWLRDPDMTAPFDGLERGVASDAVLFRISVNQ